MTFEEYQRMAMMILSVMKEFEAMGQDSVQQTQIIDKMIRKIEIESNQRNTSLERTVETQKKVSSVIQNLITKENMLLIT